MRKMTKSQRINQIADQLARQQGVISKLTIAVKEQNEAILMLEKLTDEKLRDQPEPQLKQLDQSVFDGEPEQIKWAVVTSEGAVLKFELEPVVKDGLWHWTHSNGCRQHSLIGQYDASNWQNSLIERDTVKELLEVDLSSELTGSDLCRAMLARGDKYIVCTVDYGVVVITGSNKDGSFFSTDCAYTSATPINNQGEPLTAAEAGL